MRKILYGLLGLVGILFISLPFIDWQSFKEPILEKVQQMSGCQIQLKGPMYIKFFPTPQIVLKQAFIEPATSVIGTDSLQLLTAKAKSIVLSWAWLPLLRGKLDIHHLNLEEPIIILKTTSLKGSNSSPSTPSDSNSSSTIPPFALRDFSVQKGEIIIDPDTSQQQQIKDINVKGSITSSKGPANVSGYLDYNDMGLNLNLTLEKPTDISTPLKGSLLIRYQKQEYGPLFFMGHLQKDGLEIGLNTKGLKIPNFPKPISLKGDITYRQNLLKTHINLEDGTNQLLVLSNTNIDKGTTDLALTSKKLTYLNYYIENLNADVKIKGKDILFNKIEADIYEGKLKAKGHLYPNQKLDFQGHLSRINLVKIEALQDSPVKKGRLEAVTNLSLNLEELGKFLETLEGTLQANVTEGGVETLDVKALTTQFKKVNDLSSLVKGIELTKKRNTLDIHTLNADFQIYKGQAKTDNIKILAGSVDILGKGVIDLVKKGLNLKLSVKIKALGNLTIPFKVVGPWEKPDYGVNQESLGVLMTQSYGDQVVDKIMSQVRKQVNKAADQVGQKQGSSQNLNPAQIAKNLVGNLLR